MKCSICGKENDFLVIYKQDCYCLGCLFMRRPTLALLFDDLVGVARQTALLRRWTEDEDT